MLNSNDMEQCQSTSVSVKRSKQWGARGMRLITFESSVPHIQFRFYFRNRGRS